ncbi:MAG TPA: DUF433 domain-containing protein [Candidatus Saccharimonadales bacterium]|nr:DUF433 domain-containing protein [Candidatus Saccharimonadales bacterium]
MKKASGPKKVYIKGSKVPITFLFDYIKKGYGMSDFLSSYPWIKKEDVVKKLEEFEKEEIASRYAF